MLPISLNVRSLSLLLCWTRSLLPLPRYILYGGDNIVFRWYRWKIFCNYVTVHFIRLKGGLSRTERHPLPLRKLQIGKYYTWNSCTSWDCLLNFWLWFIIYVHLKLKLTHHWICCIFACVSTLLNSKISWNVSTGIMKMF